MIKDLIFNLDGYTAFIKINRPPNNFFDPELIKQLADIIEKMDNNIGASSRQRSCG